MEQTEVSVAQREQITIAKNKNLLAELWGFLKERKMWWLLPIIIVLVITSALIIVGQSSVASPFIYALF